MAAADDGDVPARSVESSRRSKKRKAVEAAQEAPPCEALTGSAAAAEETPVPAAESSRRKKSKTIEVAVEVPPDGNGRSVPAVGYFSSGYDPTSGGVGSSGCRVRMFRHAQRPARVELVVSPPEGEGVEFVGRSYTGEAATPQLCSYALGVLDKETKTLKIVPIAANKIFRLEPQLEGSRIAPAEQSEGVTDISTTLPKIGSDMQGLTALYGTKKDRDKDNKWRSIKEHLNDTKAFEHQEEETPEEPNDEAGDLHINVQNIPPYDPSADSPEKAYKLDEIISKVERPHLLGILEHIHQEQTFLSENYPTFVANRIARLRDIKDREKREQLTCALSYITNLLKFRERSSSRKFSHDSEHAHRNWIPDILFNKFSHMFLDPESRKLSTEKGVLLIGYVLVLTLFVDDFHSDTTDICKDLKMTIQTAKPYYQNLGVKLMRETTFKPFVATLRVPLEFPKEKKRRKQSRR